MEGFFVLAIVFIVVGMPTLSFTGAFVATNLAKRYFMLRREELELRRWEAEARLEQARLSSGMPLWIDRTDPMEVASWHKAVHEVFKLSARSHAPGLSS